MAGRRNKTLIWELWRSLNHVPERAASKLRSVLADNVAYYGFYPFKRLDGADCLIETLWQPLWRAMPDLLRRPYILLANSFEGGEWVASTGDFIGAFVNDWLGIPANGQTVTFRFGEFCRIDSGKITEVRMLVDLPQLLRQVSRPILPPSYGRDISIPGPLAGDGVSHEPNDVTESARTLALAEEMIFGGLNKYDQKSQDSQGLERFMSADYTWHGPTGIGSAYGLCAFKRDAQGPIVAAFPDRKGVGHQARIADGIYAASTGWPSLVGTHRNEFMGWAPTGEKVGWDIMDFWRRDGDLLRENWVLIDLIHAALQSDVELYPPLKTYATPPQSIGEE